MKVEHFIAVRRDCDDQPLALYKRVLSGRADKSQISSVATLEYGKGKVAYLEGEERRLDLPVSFQDYYYFSDCDTYPKRKHLREEFSGLPCKRRVPLDRSKEMSRRRQASNDPDYVGKKDDSLRLLGKGNSVEAVHRKTGVPKSTLYQWRRGLSLPS